MSLSIFFFIRTIQQNNMFSIEEQLQLFQQQMISLQQQYNNGPLHLWILNKAIRRNLRMTLHRFTSLVLVLNMTGLLQNSWQTYCTWTCPFVPLPCYLILYINLSISSILPFRNLTIILRLLFLLLKNQWIRRKG